MVNDLFAKFAYVRPMIDCTVNMKRAASLMLALIFAALLLMPSSAHAQSEDIDWGDAGQPSLGVFANGTVVVGSDGTTATVTRTVTTDGGTFTPASFAGDFLSYFSGQIGAGTRPLLFNMDNSAFDPDDFVTYDIVLNRSVENLNFVLSDVDVAGIGIDAIEVFYDDDLTGAFTNAANNTALWTIGSSVARTNDAVINGWRGIAGADQFGTAGDIAFDFNTTQVRRIRVVMRSYTGSGDPSQQFVGMSTLTFDERTIAPGADLSLAGALIGSPPVQGGTATWRLTVTNNSISTQTATGVIVRETFPAAFSFTSSAGDGSFDSASGNWTVPNLAPGASASITLTGTISATAGSTVTNVAEIIAANEADVDSTPNNGVTSEDDFATTSFTVQSGRAPGVPPVLSCPAGVSIFDWDAIPGWTAGSTDNTYDLAGLGDIRFQLTNDGAYQNNAQFGGQNPTVFNVFTGGLSPVEDSLTVVADQTDQSGEVVITITLPRAFTGVQFSVFDVDFGANQFADRLEVVGSNGGTTVNPQLTNGNVNFVSGNVIIGDGAANSDTALGNVVVTFTQAVDTITLRYGNHTTAPLNPGQQGIGLHDLYLCSPDVNLTVSKVSSIIADPINGSNNPKAIPGATVEYLITITNTGTDAIFDDTLRVRDDGPPDARMCLMARNGGPVIFGDPGGNSGLNYQYGGTGTVASDLQVPDDDLEFSNDNGASFGYQPSDDGTGCDSNITNFRVVPSGGLEGGETITITVRYEIE